MEYYLLSEEEQRNAWPASIGPFKVKHRVQLLTRTWRIRDQNKQIIDEIHGPGVVGAHPMLAAGMSFAFACL